MAANIEEMLGKYFPMVLIDIIVSYSDPDLILLDSTRNRVKNHHLFPYVAKKQNPCLIMDIEGTITIAWRKHNNTTGFPTKIIPLPPYRHGPTAILWRKYSQIQIFDLFNGGGFKSQWSHPCLGSAKEVVASWNGFFVLDLFGTCIRQLNMEGELVGIWNFGTDYSFRSLAVLPSNRVVMIENYTNLVHVFHLETGYLVQMFDIKRPTQLIWEPVHQHLLVLDSLDSTIYCFDKKGKLVKQFLCDGNARDIVLLPNGRIALEYEDLLIDLLEYV